MHQCTDFKSNLLRNSTIIGADACTNLPLSNSQMSAELGKNLLKLLIIPRNARSSFLSLGSISVSSCTFLGSGLTPGLDIILPKNKTSVHLKWHLSLFSFRLTYLHICSTFNHVSSWSLPLLSYPTTIMSFAIPNTVGKSLNILFFFCWNISPVGATQSGSLWMCTCQIGIQML